MLELVNVVKKFNISGNKEDERVALDHVSLQIKPGEFVTVIGGNGSGKSTTLNIISGALAPDSGKVLLNGFDTAKIPEYKRAAYFGRVFQDPMMGTAADMSVYENLEVAYARGRTHSPIKWGFSEKHKQYFIEELKRFDLELEDRMEQKVGVLSGGQRQALTLLMATMRQRPSERVIKRDYVRFCEGDKTKEEIEIILALAKAERKYSLKRRIELHKYRLNYNKSYLKDKKLIKEMCQKENKEFRANKKSDIEKINNDYYEIIDRYDFKTKAKDEFEKAFSSAKEKKKTSLNGLKANKSLSKQERKEMKQNILKEYDAEISKFDLTKQILLLDEHTAALDPKTAAKVLDITERVVKENNLTTIMITHNMKDAIRYGNRLIMMSHGKVVVDVSGEEKQKLTVEDLLNMFQTASKDDYLSDSTILG